ncbi:hypothetical protein [Streptomyces sp. NPDC059452]|uniref:hypothetical protein n=1 Tax=Streptomyces sp. NPDC059452 TaxID=3346835 RepID=UPI0036A32AA6
MTGPVTRWRPVTDDMVLYRAVTDHTAACEVCRAQAGNCPYSSRLSEMARVARDIVREERSIGVRVGADTGRPTGPHCRAAVLDHRTALHMECVRPSGGCACYCHQDGPPTQ